MTDSSGEILRRFRVLAGLTQEELAERSGYSVHYVSKLERDKRRPPVAALDRLAAALDLGDEERDTLRAAADGTLQAEQPGRRLVGRTREVGEIRRLLAGLGPPVLLFSGEPGIGKTRLLEEAATRAAESGWRVVRGGCQRRAQDPYAPITSALADTIEALPNAERESVLRGAGQLGLLLPELGVIGGQPVPGGSTHGWAETVRPSDQERRLLFASVGRFLGGVASGAGTLLVLDDLQWAGADAFDLLAALITGAETPPIRIIAAYRDSETEPASPLGTVIADFARASLIRVSPLEPLSPDDAEALVYQLIASDAGSRVALPVIVRRAGGIPFFLVSYVEELQAHGYTKSNLELPWNVSRVILQRVAALPEVAQDLLRVAAVVGRAAPASLLSQVTGRGVDEVLEALDAATSARLLHEDEEEGYRFAHDLIRETIEGELSRSRRQLLHRRIGEALERDTSTPAESLAFHFDLSDDVQKAVWYLDRAGDDALERFAHAGAAAFYRRALDRAGHSNTQHDGTALQEKLGIALHRSGRYEEAINALARALDGYRAAKDAEGVDRATGRLAEAHYQRGTGHEVLPEVTRLLERDSLDSGAGGSAGALGLRESLVRLLFSQGSFKRLLTVGRSLRRLGRTTGNRRLQRMGTRVEGAALVYLGRLGEGTAMIESTMPENPAIEGDERITDIATVLCAAYLVMGSIDRGLAVSTRMLPVAESINDAVGSAALTSLIGAALHITGAWEEARDYIQGAGEQFAALGPSATSVRFIPVLAECLIREGRWSEARQHLDAAVEASRSMRAYHPERTAITFLGLIDVLEGRTDAAIRRLEPLLAHDPGWVYAVTLPSTLAGAYLEAGDVERARALAQRAVSEARRMGAWLWAVEALRVLGIAEMQLKNYDLAARTLGEGLQRARVIPFPYAEARSLHAFGLLDQQRGDVKSSHAKFSEALAIVERMGATWQAERFRATLRT